MLPLAFGICDGQNYFQTRLIEKGIHTLIDNEGEIIVTYVLFFQQPAGLATGSVDKGASTKKEELDATSNGEEKPGTQIIPEIHVYENDLFTL